LINSLELHRVGIASTQNNTNTLAGRGPVGSAEKRCERRGSAGLGSNFHDAPKGPLRFADGVVFDEHGLLDVLLGQREHELADLTGRERLSGDPTSLRIDRPSRLARPKEGRSRTRFNSHESNPSSEPRRHATDEATAADGNEQVIESVESAGRLCA
jgi:hypothetical protein